MLTLEDNTIFIFKLTKIQVSKKKVVKNKVKTPNNYFKYYNYNLILKNVYIK